MDLNPVTVCYWMPWYEKALLLFIMVYPVLGVVMARRRLERGRGSVVTLATLPLTVGAVKFWLELSAAKEAIRLSSFSNAVVFGIAEAPVSLFVACLSTLLVLAGTLPYRAAAVGKEPGSARLASIVSGAPFVLAFAGMIYGMMLRQLSALPGSLVGTVLGLAFIGLHLLAIGLPRPPESRATAMTVFVSTIILALVIWQYRQQFQVIVD
jgi:hypothetical protein